MYVCNICMYGRPQNKPAAGSTPDFLTRFSLFFDFFLFSHALLIRATILSIPLQLGEEEYFVSSSPLPSLFAFSRPSFFFLSRVSWPSSNSKAAASFTSFSTCSTSRARSRRLLSRSLGFATHCFLQFFRASRIVTLWQQYSYLLRRRRPRICQPADPLSLTCPMPPTPLPDRACFLRNGQGRPVPSWISLMDNHRRRNR